VKAARGGYDGKGVWPVADRAEAAGVLEGVAGQVVVEELLPLDAELAVMVARRPSGASAAWPAVETAQVGGVCREVLVPGRLQADVLEAASALGQKVAEIAGGVGVMAVELFWSGGRLLVNEVATRPHNSGHWTMEGAVTSQFENHVRAVLDLPLGSTAPQHPQVASVNVFGGPDGADPGAPLPRGLTVEGAHVHLYGKKARPGRKLGHVTVCGDEAEAVRTRAWAAAIALGTPVPDGIELPAGVLR
jgi:5-(carboxyamino)imidazole ribonucleotide synthase